MKKIDTYETFTVCDPDNIIVAHSFDINDINWSNIIDKLIRCAAKYTKRYASDIFIDLKGIEHDLKNIITNRYYVFGFRDNGVDRIDQFDNAMFRDMKSQYHSFWELSIKKDYVKKGDTYLQLFELKIEEP